MAACVHADHKRVYGLLPWRENGTVVDVRSEQMILCIACEHATIVRVPQTWYLQRTSMVAGLDQGYGRWVWVVIEGGMGSGSGRARSWSVPRTLDELPMPTSPVVHLSA